MIKGFNEAVDRIRRAIEFGVNCNDLSLGELADEICFAMDKLAEDNGEPEIDWEYHSKEEQADDGD